MLEIITASLSTLFIDLASFINFLITTYGLIGLFFAAVIANATIFFGVPFEAVIIILVSTTGLNPILVGLVGGIGAAIGETTGYFIGRGGNLALEKFKKEQVEKIEEYAQKIKNQGTVLIAVLAFLPFPFDVIGIAAGLAEFDFKKFFVASLIGKTSRYLLIAFLASIGVKALFGFF